MNRILQKLRDSDAGFVRFLKRIVRPLRNAAAEALVRFRGFLRKRGIFRDENARKLAAYQNCHEGQRCFLIGNGPSLTTADLDLLAGEKSIGCNMVYKVFDKTAWRPTYHCITESAYAKRYAREFADNIHTPFFTTKSCRKAMPVCPADTVYAENLSTRDYYVHGNLLDYYVTPFASVMVFMLELAIYMGFREIYLLGVDNTNSLRSGGHFIQGYENDEVIHANIRRVQKQLDAKTLSAEEAGNYQVLRAQNAYRLIGEYAKAHGIRICNATRGGNLEIFPRVTLEEILAAESKDPS